MSLERKLGAIAPVLLKMLSQKWRGTEGYSSFDSVWGDDDDQYSRERRAFPAWYFYYHSAMDKENNGLTGKEVEYLFHLLEYDGIIREVSNGYAVNEHCQHAICDFCSEVYDAHEKLQKRLLMTVKQQRGPR